jgi:hypothetical protein
MKLIQRSDNARSTERGPIVLPSLNDADRPSGRARTMSVGTRVDLIVLSLWLIAAGLAAIGIISFLLYSYLAAIATGA